MIAGSLSALAYRMQRELRAIYPWWEGDMSGSPLSELHSLVALFNTDVDLLR